MIGNVTNISVQYDRTSQTITCTSTGGPATDVTWSKDNVNIRLTMGGRLYEHSQIIINTTSATYENRLRIVDKSSEAAGNYTCEVTNTRGGINGSLYIQGNEHKVADSANLINSKGMSHAIMGQQKSIYHANVCNSTLNIIILWTKLMCF